MRTREQIAGDLRNALTPIFLILNEMESGNIDTRAMMSEERKLLAVMMNDAEIARQRVRELLLELETEES